MALARVAPRARATRGAVAPRRARARRSTARRARVERARGAVAMLTWRSTRVRASRARTTTTARAEDDADDARDRDDDARDDARARGVALEDGLLVLGDVTVMWMFVLCKKVSAVSAAADFPGWLAPIEVTARSAAAFSIDAAWSLIPWVVVSAVLTKSYEIDWDETPSARRAASEVVRTWAVWAPLQAVGVVLATKGGLAQEASHGLLVSTLTALGVMLGWRCYAKVFSLLAPSRSSDNAASDDVEWGEFYRVFGGVAALCVACAVAEMIYYGGGDALLEF